MTRSFPIQSARPVLVPIDFPFPLKGTHQGTAIADQPPETTPNLLNVRGTDYRDRRGGGKRGGHSKALDPQAGSALSRRLTALSLLLPGTAAQVGAATLVAVDDTFTTAGGFPAAANPPMTGNWCLADNVISTAAATKWEADQGTDAGANRGIQTDGNQLIGGGGSGFGNGVVCMFGTTNDVTAYINATGQVAVNEQTVQQCTRVGPFIRFANNAGSGLFCWLRQAGVDTVNLQIVQYDTSVASPFQVVLATSGNQATGGAAGILAQPYIIRLRIDPADGLLTATATNATSGLNLSIKASAAQSAFLGTQIRGGVLYQAPAVVANADYRRIARIQLTKLVPVTPSIILDASATIAGTVNKFKVPVGTFARKQNVNDGTDIVAEVAGGDEINAADQVPRVDINNDQYQCTDITAGGTGSNRVYLAMAAPPSQSLPGVQWWLKNTTAGLGTYGATFTLTDSVGGLWFVSADRKAWFGVVSVEHSLFATANARLICNLTALHLRCRNSAGAEVVVLQEAVQQNPTLNGVLCRRDLPSAGVPQNMQWVFDGGAVTLVINGLAMRTVSLPRDGAGSYTDGVYGATLNAIKGNTGAGMMFVQSGAIAGTRAFGGYFVFTVPPAVDYSPFAGKLLIASSGKFDVGDMRADTVTGVTGPGPIGALPAITSAFGKWYVVDGISNIVVDPATLISAPWIATAGKGAVPAGTALIATYRGRVVVALGSVWYMSRAGDPLDWLYGAPPVSTAPYNGTDASFGQPADVIVSLMTFGDDYLIFGCAESLWKMEGDPGYQGLCNNLSQKTGVMGSRSWCFDEKGNLYFLGGGGGLYVLRAGTKDPENISDRRMTPFFDKIDAGANLVQLAYDAFRRYVHIYVTAADGVTNNNHAVYEPAVDAFWIDQLPAGWGPWSVADSMGARFFERSVLLGCNDGYVRRSDPRRNDDDGSAIDAWVEIGPFALNKGKVESMATELQAMMGAGSEAVAWSWFRANSPEEVARQTFGDEVASGTWGPFATAPGRQYPIGLRQTGGAHKLRIRSTTSTGSWALEKVIADLREAGRVRTGGAIQ